MDSNVTLRPPSGILLNDGKIHVVNTCKVKGKLMVTVRLVKTPPMTPSPRPIEQNCKTVWISGSLPNSPVNKVGKEKRSQHPADFIEPALCTKEFMQMEESENELCDTLPILPKAYTIRPSVALRNSIKKREKNKFGSPKIVKKNFVNVFRK